MVNIDVELDGVVVGVSDDKGAEATREGGEAIEGEELEKFKRDWEWGLEGD